MMRWFRRTLRVATLGMLAWAVVTELRKPREERTWEGSLAGVVPYDFRLPTPARVRRRWWNHDDEHIFTPHVFGVGWSVNLARALDLLRERCRPASTERAAAAGPEATDSLAADSHAAERPQPD